MRNLVLIGFMGSGKSTVGRECARILKYRFRDSDALVERRAGKPVHAIFADHGEAEFRTMKSSAILTLASLSSTVLSTGGGAILNPSNVEVMRRNGIVILLWAEPETVVSRTSSRATRPLLSGYAEPTERVTELLAQREAAYRSAAHAVVDTTFLSRDEVVERVLTSFHCLAAEIGSTSESGT